MRTITVNVADLLEIVTRNKEIHADVFERAWTRWREKVLDQMERNLNTAKAGGPAEVYIGLEKPETHNSDYERVIRMLQMHMEKTIEVTQDEFAQFVQDDWGWKRQWLATASRYLEEN